MTCEPCLIANNRSVAVRTAIRLAVTALVFAGGAAFGASQASRLPVEAGLIMGGAFVCVLWGWLFIGDHSSEGFWIALSPFGWCVFLFVRLMIGAVLGVFAAPWGIVTGVIQLVRIRRTGREIRTRAI